MRLIQVLETSRREYGLRTQVILRARGPCPPRLIREDDYIRRIVSFLRSVVTSVPKLRDAATRAKMFCMWPVHVRWRHSILSGINLLVLSVNLISAPLSLTFLFMLLSLLLTLSTHHSHHP